MASEREDFFGELRALRKEVRGVVRFAEVVSKLVEERIDGQLSVTKNRAAAMLGISRSTLDRMVAEKELGEIEIHGRKMISMMELIRITSSPKRVRKPEAPSPAHESSQGKAVAQRIRDLAKARRRRG